MKTSVKINAVASLIDELNAMVLYAAGKGKMRFCRK
jgi:hypothetical protein